MLRFEFRELIHRTTDFVWLRNGTKKSKENVKV